MRPLSFQLPHYHSHGRNDLIEAAIPFLLTMTVTLIVMSVAIYLYAASIG